MLLLREMSTGGQGIKFTAQRKLESKYRLNGLENHLINFWGGLSCTQDNCYFYISGDPSCVPVQKKTTSIRQEYRSITITELR